ncbi:hypothetical protein BDF19DRAFT_421396 [Syncephalis fuscata]|nr:hypothetical protein BDF19DRAFT_421396 [Syncephalis fuscata]
MVPRYKNGVIITGYSIDGTLAKHILSEPSEIQSMAGAKLPLRMSVDYISFSAHVDFTQNSSLLKSRYKERNKPVNIYTPRNCETVQLHFRGEKRAKTVGKLAEKMPIEDQLISGVMVAKDYQYSIMASMDLEDLVVYRQQMYGAIDESRLNLESANNDWSKPATVKYTIMNAVDLIPGPDSGTMTLEWAASPVNDMVADSIVALLLGVVDTSPASVKLAGQSGSCCSSPQASSITEMDVKEEAEEKEEEEALKQTIKTEIKDDENADLAAAKKEAKAEATDAANGLNAIASKARRSGGDSIDTAGWATFLREQFDNVEIKSHPSRIRIAIDDVSAEINLTNLCISTTSLEFRKRLEPVVQRIALTLQPIE